MSKEKVDMEALARDLQNMGTPKRSRLARILKWFFVILVLLLIAGGGYAAWYIHQLTSNNSYQQAMGKILESDEIKASLGAPIKTDYLKPPPSFAKDGDNLDIWWSIVGAEKKQAKVHIKTRLMNGKYETVGSIEVVLPGGKKVLLSAAGGDDDAPVFNPPPAPNATDSANPPAKPEEENLPEELMPKIPKVDETK